MFVTENIRAEKKAETPATAQPTDRRRVEEKQNGRGGRQVGEGFRQVAEGRGSGTGRRRAEGVQCGRREVAQGTGV